MEPWVQSKLLDINQNFYDRFASSFSATRHQVQPGVTRLIQRLITCTSILDVGCGNGTLARALINWGYTGRYLGVDMSEHLLSKAREMTPDPPQGDFSFQLVDLANEDWQTSIPHQLNDWLTCFAVLHHLPGEDFQKRTVDAFAQLIHPRGHVTVSVWQWQNSPRMRKRVLPWSTVGLNPENLDEGDVLLDWRAGDTPGLRYVHTFTKESLTALAINAGFQVLESFYSDGKTGDLALYQVWQPRD